MSTQSQSIETTPENKGLIWRMVQWQTPIIATIIHFLTAPLFVGLFYVSGFSIQQSVILIISMYLHELGHAYLLQKNQIKIKIISLFPLGVGVFPINLEENKKSDQLSSNKLANMIQAGPMTNVALILMGIIISAINPQTQIGKDLIHVNMLLSLTNLPPIWKLDAGQLFNLISVSLNRKKSQHLSKAILATATTISVFMLGIKNYIHPNILSTNFLEAFNHTTKYVPIASIYHFDITAILLVITLGIIFKSTKDYKKLFPDTKPMTKNQILNHFAVYLLQIGFVIGVYFTIK